MALLCSVTFHFYESLAEAIFDALKCQLGFCLPVQLRAVGKQVKNLLLFYQICQLEILQTIADTNTKNSEIQKQGRFVASKRSLF